MKKQLYIHIGHYKTGTTALQVFLARNPGYLAKHGVEYAPVLMHHAKHSSLGFSLCREAGVTRLMHGYNAPTPAAEIWGELFDHVRRSPHKAVIVSSEEMIRIGEFPAACDRLREIAATARDIDVTVIAYLRNPESHLRSWYNQLVKMGIPVSDYTTALRGEIEGIHLDYARALRPWAEAFGAENLVLRDYDAARRAGPTGIYTDFLGILGLSFSDSLSQPEGDPNPRIDDRAVELVRLMQNMKLPRHTIEAVRDQAAQYLAKQDKLHESRLPPFQATLDQVREGLESLAGLAAQPGCNVDLAGFHSRLPRPEDPALADQIQMTGFVLGELLALRKRINRALPSLNARLKTLEKRLDIVAQDTDADDQEPDSEAQD